MPAPAGRSGQLISSLLVKISDVEAIQNCTSGYIYPVGSLFDFLFSYFIEYYCG